MEPSSLSDSVALKLPDEIMEMGDNQQLNTALIQQLDNAATCLDAWIAGGGRLENAEVCRQVKGFLIGMNVYPRLPLGFRLQALDELAEACKTCDAKIILAMLTSYQHALSQLQGNEYACFRIQIIAHALKLAIRFYRDCLFEYKSLDVKVINRVLHLANTGFATRTETIESDAGTLALKHSIGKHELIRRLDFFGQDRDVQEQLWQDADKLAGTLSIHCVGTSQDFPRLKGSSFMISNLSKPASSPSIVADLPGRLPYDAWVMPLDALLKQVRQSRQRYKILSGQDGKIRYQDDEQMNPGTALTSAECFLEALGQPRRKTDRQVSISHEVAIEWNAVEAITISQGIERARQRNLLMWSIVDIHKGGVGLKCVGSEPIQAEINSLVGLRWVGSNRYPKLGFLRWQRSELQGEHKLGIEFFRLDADVKKCITAGSNPMRRVIPVLIPTSSDSAAIFPVAHLRKGTHFILLEMGGRKAIRIGEVLKTGPNYTACRIENKD